MELSHRFKVMYDIYRLRQAKFRIPSIIISSTLGLLSFGNNNFDENSQKTINIIVGAVSVMLAITNSVETYMKIGENMSGALLSSSSYQKLAEHINLELALPTHERCSNGLLFLRECYSQYEKTTEASPNILAKNRFILQDHSSITPFTATPNGSMESHVLILS